MYSLNNTASFICAGAFCEKTEDANQSQIHRSDSNFKQYDLVSTANIVMAGTMTHTCNHTNGTADVNSQLYTYISLQIICLCMS